MDHHDPHRDGLVPGRLAMESSSPVKLRAVDIRVSATGPPDGCGIDDLASRDSNRWSHAGEPTVYLGSSDGVAMAEFGRHLDASPRDVGLWSLRLRASALADLRPLRVTAPTELLDRRRCTEVARRWRSLPECEGLLVPSVAFLDRADCWNVVLFLERLRRRPGDVLTDARPTGMWRTVR